ncbi:hypothetical protein IQ268_22440 [Oculatella sp. LEGE 06141]|uniref:hypothetical protein n=1 Tax=Oculatella sp. LEGE 06141 TaxID=1828648 RepID=UPI00187FF4BE|nr:hypothetical protein [Oculatella sp. LEGE 06141]MBE9181324.1 hypothetical protein [Oculatella sp. LEGE 06141]
MVSVRWQRVLAPLLLSLLLLVSACSSPQEPSRFAQTQEETTQKGAPPAVDPDAQKGGSFNQFFPRSVEGYEIVPAQEKQGFAEYKVNQDGVNVAMLAISDTTGSGAADKFQSSTETIATYPAVEQGQTATAILVGDRYQVKVLSRAPSFTQEDRAAWIEKFDLNGLANLQ